ETYEGRDQRALKRRGQQRRNRQDVHESQQRADGNVDSAGEDRRRARDGGQRERRKQVEVAAHVLRRGEPRLDKDVYNGQEGRQAGGQGPRPAERGRPPPHVLCSRPKKLAIRRCRSRSSRPNSVNSAPSLKTITRSM